MDNSRFASAIYLCTEDIDNATHAFAFIISRMKAAGIDCTQAIDLFIRKDVDGLQDYAASLFFG